MSLELLQCSIAAFIRKALARNSTAELETLATSAGENVTSRS